MKADKYSITLGGEMVELRPEKVQKSPKERVRGHGETSLDVGNKQHALVTLRRGLDLVCLRPPPPVRRDEALFGELL
jgi:hypothetical protein